MAMIAQDRAYPDEARYWAMVQRTMVEVFDKPASEADTLVRRHVRSMADASPAERLLSFHAEPLDVAASLLKLTGDADQAEHMRYRTLAKSVGWERITRQVSTG